MGTLAGAPVIPWNTTSFEVSPSQSFGPEDRHYDQVVDPGNYQVGYYRISRPPVSKILRMQSNRPWGSWGETLCMSWPPNNASPSVTNLVIMHGRGSNFSFEPIGSSWVTDAPINPNTDSYIQVIGAPGSSWTITFSPVDVPDLPSILGETDSCAGKVTILFQQAMTTPNGESSSNHHRWLILTWTKKEGLKFWRYLMGSEVLNYYGLPYYKVWSNMGVTYTQGYQVSRDGRFVFTGAVGNNGHDDVSVIPEEGEPMQMVILSGKSGRTAVPGFTTAGDMLSSGTRPEWNQPTNDFVTEWSTMEIVGGYWQPTRGHAARFDETGILEQTEWPYGEAHTYPWPTEPYPYDPPGEANNVRPVAEYDNDLMRYVHSFIYEIEQYPDPVVEVSRTVYPEWTSPGWDNAYWTMEYESRWAWYRRSIGGEIRWFRWPTFHACPKEPDLLAPDFVQVTGWFLLMNVWGGVAPDSPSCVKLPFLRYRQRDDVIRMDAGQNRPTSLQASKTRVSRPNTYM